MSGCRRSMSRMTRVFGGLIGCGWLAACAQILNVHEFLEAVDAGLDGGIDAAGSGFLTPGSTSTPDGIETEAARATMRRIRVMQRRRAAARGYRRRSTSRIW